MVDRSLRLIGSLLDWNDFPKILLNAFTFMHVRIDSCWYVATGIFINSPNNAERGRFWRWVEIVNLCCKQTWWLYSFPDEHVIGGFMCLHEHKSWKHWGQGWMQNCISFVAYSMGQRNRRGCCRSHSSGLTIHDLSTFLPLPDSDGLFNVHGGVLACHWVTNCLLSSLSLFAFFSSR